MKLKKYRHLLKQLIKFDLNVKYKGSVLGIFWSLLEPVSKFAIMFFVFSFLFNRDPDFPVYLFSGLIVWQFFSKSSQSNVNRIISKSSLVKKVNFPREILVVSAVLSNTVDFFVTLIPLFIVMVYSNVLPGINLFFIIPFLIVFLLLNLGVGFFLSSTNVFMRDIQYIWNVILRAGFYATPIFYELNTFPRNAQILITLNPVTGLVNFFRGAVVYGTNIPWISFGYSCIASIVIFIIGFLTFNHYKGRFAEEV